jgi:hypothetical protein
MGKPRNRSGKLGAYVPLASPQDEINKLATKALNEAKTKMVILPVLPGLVLAISVGCVEQQVLVYKGNIYVATPRRA